MSAREPHALFGDHELTMVVTDPPYYENCYLVRHVPTGQVVIVDPGSAAEKIADEVRAAGGTPVAVLLTHGHPDHIGAVRSMQKTFDIPCRAHQAEKMVIDGAARMAVALAGQRMDPPEKPDYFDGEPAMPFGAGSIRVIHTPGHTPGGVCYDFGGFVLTGDTLFNQGVGRTDFPGGDEKQLVASITRLLGMLGEEVELFSGHGPNWPVGEARGWWKWMAGG